MSMCVSYGISLCLCKISINLFGLFTFAKIPDNNISFETLGNLTLEKPKNEIKVLKNLEKMSKCDTSVNLLIPYFWVF